MFKLVMFLCAVKGRSLSSAMKEGLLLGYVNPLLKKYALEGCQSIFTTRAVVSLSCNKFVHLKHSTDSMGEPVKVSRPLIIFGHLNNLNCVNTHSYRKTSSTSENKGSLNETPMSNKDKLKRAVKDYGATVIIFHVTISLISLGMSYLIISSGMDVADVASLLDRVGFSSSSDIAAGASTFVVAYAVHKMFAPVRISITLGSTPFIVRYLRRIGFLKPPKSQS